MNKLGPLFIAAATAFGLQSAAAQQPSLTTETYGSWTYRCTNPAAQQNADDTTKANVKKACETIQILRDAKGNVIAQIAFGKDAADPKKLVGVFQVPQGTLLSEPVKFGAEGEANPLAAPYFTCLQSICLARMNIAGDGLKKLYGKEKGALEFADRSGRKINVLLSLQGFAAAIGRLTEKQ